MANKEHVAIVLQGREALEQWLVENLTVQLNLRWANLIRVNLIGANLRDADLREANLSEANLRGANFSGADLYGANLREANLSEANLSEADLRRTNLRRADLNRADLRGSDLRGADLYGATNLTLEQLRPAQFDLSRLLGEPAPAIERSIEFPPEHHQAGVQILNHFGTILRTKYPDSKPRIRIEQEGLKVTLSIHADDGDVQRFEEELDRYGLVVMGDISPEDYSDNQEIVRDLKNRLEITAMELRLKKEQYLDARQAQDTRIESLEIQVGQLTTLVGQGLAQMSSLSEVLRLALDNRPSEQALHLIDRIVELSQADHTPEQEAALKAQFEQLQKDDPSAYAKILDRLSAIPMGIMTNIATPWVQTVINALPK